MIYARLLCLLWFNSLDWHLGCKIKLPFHQSKVKILRQIYFVQIQYIVIYKYYISTTSQVNYCINLSYSHNPRNATAVRRDIDSHALNLTHISNTGVVVV